jgi:hypothetical protein
LFFSFSSFARVGDEPAKLPPLLPVNETEPVAELVCFIYTGSLRGAAWLLFMANSGRKG